METGRGMLILCIACIAVITGCATMNPLSEHYENGFAHFQAADQLTGQSSPLQRTFHASFEEVWDKALYILTQHSIIIDTSREAGMITYLKVDSEYFGDVFGPESYYFWEYPYTVEVDEGDQGITVFVYPMRDMYSERQKKRKWWCIVDEGFDQNAEEFLRKLSTQLTVQDRWQWLRD